MGLKKNLVIVAAVLLAAAVSLSLMNILGGHGDGDKLAPSPAGDDSGELARGGPAVVPPQGAAPDPGVTSGESKTGIGDEAATVPGGASRATKGNLEGEIRDSAGRPVKGAEILLSRPGASRSALAFALLATPRPTSDARGRFRLDALADQEYRLTVSAPGYLDAVIPARPGGESLRIELEEAFSISGRVLDEASKTGVAGANLRAYLANISAGAAHRFVESGADGSFTFTKLPAGNYRIEVRAYFQTGESDADAFLPMKVGPVKAGARDLRVLLTRGLTISGRILGPGGAPVNGNVGIKVRGLLPGGDPDPTRLKFAYARKGGVFRVGGLLEGSYRLGFVPETDGGPAELPSVVAGTEGLEVRLGPGRVITGRLEDDAGNLVTSTGYIYAYAEGTTPADATATMASPLGDGTFRTAPLNPDKKYNILTSGFSGHDQGHLTGVVPGAEDVVVVLPRAGR